jgi:threonine synthase
MVKSRSFSSLVSSGINLTLNENEHVLFATHFGKLRCRRMQNESKKSGGGGVISRYRIYLPVTETTPIVTLGEGSTPLVFAPRLSERIDCRVLIKCEGSNPTGSFKDRGMTVAVSKAVEYGAQALVCASTGNTSASAAAYAARAGIRCAVILPAGKIASGKLVQAIAHGARIVSINGNFDDALHIVRELGTQDEFAIVNSINPDRIAGQKTAAFEIVDELGDAPDIHILPLGNAGNLTAYAAGYSEYKQLGKLRRLPRMIGIQAEHAAPIFHHHVIEKPETIASAIRIGNPASWEAAERAIDDSSGAVEIVTDREILEAQSWLAQTEGIFVEPASAAPIAGLLKLAREKRRDFMPTDATVVCTCTGHGLKDPEIVSAKLAAPVAPNVEAVREAITRS